MLKTFVVVGGSAAAMAFITKLRSCNQSCKIICVSAENYKPYNRCLLADFLTFDKEKQDLFLKQDSFFDASSNFIFLQNTRVVGFDFQSKMVSIEQGGQLLTQSYDYLFLAMGCRPYIPNFLQQQWSDGMLTFYTLADMEMINQYVDQHDVKKVIVLGGGINGVEAASSLLQRGFDVVLIEKEKKILPGQLDDQISLWVAQSLENAGITLQLNSTVCRIEKQDNRAFGAVMDDGRFIQADMIIVATGSQINNDLLQNTGIKLENGSVLVDAHLKTNIQDVFAAGDLVAAPFFGHPSQIVRSSTWADAMLQGLCAATQFSTEPRTYSGIVNLRDSYFCGLDFYACGQTMGHSIDVRKIIKTDQGALKAWYIADNRLIGFVLIKDVSRLAEYKKWYMTGQQIQESDLY